MILETFNSMKIVYSYDMILLYPREDLINLSRLIKIHV